ncbi:PTS sugar transporter subunit IIA [Enterobacteriaceae bacterium 4M9]|nr:PTS sugar transporter subunit IIA [Enterobacteriaceae bacterium 4M9]
MLGWVIAAHGCLAHDTLALLEKQIGPLAHCRAVEYLPGQSTNMLSRMMCDALHEVDGGDGVIFLTDTIGAAPYRAASLLSHKHEHCEVIAGFNVALLAQMLALRDTHSSAAFRDTIVASSDDTVTSLWHQQQKNPPFRLILPDWLDAG